MITAVFAITDNPDWAGSLERYCRHVHGLIGLHHYPIPPTTGDGNEPHCLFSRIANWIEMEIQAHGGEPALKHALVFVDVHDPRLDRLDNLDPLTTVRGQRWAPVVGMLLLAFPEIQWVLRTPHDCSWTPFCRSAHVVTYDQDSSRVAELVRLHAQGYQPLLDPSGLRNNLRRCVAQHTAGIRLREKQSAAIDEELDYAYLHAYATYREGYRAHVVGTWDMFCRLFGTEDMASNPIDLTVEDIYFNSPDRPQSLEHASSLDERERLCPGLKNVGFRLFVTSDHRSEDKQIKDGNSSSIDRLQKAGRANRCPKPMSGVFDVLKQVRKSGDQSASLAPASKPPRGLLALPDWLLTKCAGFLRSVSAATDGTEKCLRRLRCHLRDVPAPAAARPCEWLTAVLARLFAITGDDLCRWLTAIRVWLSTLTYNDVCDCLRRIWPIEQDSGSRLGAQGCESGHSAPGRILMIAERLLARSARVVRGISGAADGIHAATLALEAHELLGSRTPTVALQALGLQHQAEVMVECLFAGVAGQLVVADRLQEISLDIETIEEYLPANRRVEASLGAELNIVHTLVATFRAQCQFDEEQVCLTKTRRLSRSLRRRTRLPGWPRSSVARLVPDLLHYGFFWYVDWLVSNLTVFAICIVVWLVVLWMLFACQCTGGGAVAWMSSLTAFIGMSEPEGLKGHCWFLTTIGIVSGFVHLGILISHLYSHLSRR